MNKDHVSYYSLRANEYDQVYSKAERQFDIRELQIALSNSFKDAAVLEIGCGTAYWTPSVSALAQSVHATDINATMIEVGKGKNLSDKISFEEIDMHQLASKYPKSFSGMFGGFVWSHFNRKDLPSTLDSLHQCLQTGSQVIWIDNQFVEGSNTSIHQTDETGNTYQLRKLKDGSEHLVLKNFPTDVEFLDLLSTAANEIQIKRLTYFWMLSYRIN